MGLLDEFSLDMICEFPELYFESNDAELHQSIMEDSQGATKKNIGSKIFNILKKVWGWIVKLFSNGFNFIKQLFFKDKKSPSSILKELMIGPKKSNNENNTSGKNNKKITIIETKGSSLDEKPNIVEEIEISEIPVSLDIDKEKELVSLSISSLGEENGRRLHLLFETDYIEHINICFKCVYNHDLPDDEFNKHSKAITDFETKKFKVKSEIVIPLKRFEEVHRTLLEIQKTVFEQTIDLDVNDEKYKDQIMKLDILQKYSIKIQETLNKIQSSFMNYYILPDKYSGTIDNLGDLSKYVESMVANTYASRAILINIFKIYSGDLGTNASITNGLGRIVFFPENKNHVYKVAYNGFGVAGNKTEIMTWKKLMEHGKHEFGSDKKYGFKLKFAPIISSSKNGLIIEMERIEYNKYKMIPMDIIYEIRDRLKEISPTIGFRRVYTGDIHSGNVCKTGNTEYTLMDYGLLYVD